MQRSMKISKNTTFEEAAQRLEEIVAIMEKGEEPLEKSLQLFEEGSALSAFCYKKLSEAEQRIHEISDFEKKDGKPDGKD